MSTAIRTVDFTVTENEITPAVPQWAGVQGEHRATAVRFKVPDSFAEKGFCYRVEWIDGMQAFAISEALTADEEGCISYLLPASWTAAGGTAEVRLCACAEGDGAADGQVFYSVTGRLTFSSRDEGLPSVAETESRLYSVIGQAEQILRKTEDRVRVEVSETGGCVRFAGGLALAYGKFSAAAGESVEVTMPCSFTDICFMQAVCGGMPIPVLGRTYNSFIVQPEKLLMDAFWIAVGTLYEN